MAKAYFPMFVDISQMKIIVVGGGTIATRRIKTLLQFASDITVISPEITDQLKKLEAAGKIRHICRTYQEADIAESDMVLSAADSSKVNNQVAEDCKKREYATGRKILISIADDRSKCDFYFPSVIVRDEVVIGINSGGQDPGKVRQVRRKLEDVMGRGDMM